MRENASGRRVTLMSLWFFVKDGDKDAAVECVPDSALALCDLTFSATTIIKPRSWLKMMRKRCLFMNNPLLLHAM